MDARLGQQHLDEALVVREVRQDPLDGDELLESFRATTRPLNTSAMPPMAISSRSSYWPNFMRQT